MSRPGLLIPSVGRKVTLVRMLRNYFSVASGDIADCAGRQECSVNVNLPPSDSPEYPDALLEAIEILGTEVVLPVRNEDMLVLDDLRDEITKRGAKLVLSPSETIGVCIDKLRMWNKLAAHHLHTPYTLLRMTNIFPMSLCFHVL